MTPSRLATLKELIDAFARSGAEELEVADGALRLRILRKRGSVASPLAAPALAAVPVALAPSPEPPAVEASPVSGILVTAAMHGVFHRSPAPGAEPFVSLGGSVARGQALCILEAMKVFNAVVAPQDGVIARIHAENGEDVMAGQPLFTIETVQQMAAQ